MKEQSVLEAIQTLYDGHIRATEDYFSSLSLGESIGRTFTGRGAYSGTGLLKPFLDSLEEIIRTAAALPITQEEAADIAGFMLVTEHVPKSHPVLIELEAAEQKADPIIPLLEERAAGQLSAAYSSRYKVRRMLPSQRKTMKALEKASKPH